MAHRLKQSELPWLQIPHLFRAVAPPATLFPFLPNVAMLLPTAAALLLRQTGVSCCPTNALLLQMKMEWITSLKLHTSSTLTMPLVSS